MKIQSWAKLHASIKVLFPVILLSLLLAGCLIPEQPIEDSNPDDKVPESNINSVEQCTTAPELFVNDVWPSIQGNCLDCHSTGSIASNTALIFASDSTQILENYNRLRNYTNTDADTLLQKPIGELQHGGGAPFIDNTTLEYQNLSDLVEIMVKSCNSGSTPTPPEPPPQNDFFDGIQFQDDQETLRKAALLLAGRLPTKTEKKAVANGGEPVLNTIIRRLMQGKSFDLFLLETANNHFLSTGIDLFISRIPNGDEYPNLSTIDRNTAEGTEFYARYTRALQQEPLQLLRYLVANERPYTEILTANYTVMNPYLAFAYDADIPGGFIDANDENEWKKATIPLLSTRLNIPFPHAGVITTHAWLHRFPSTSTNRHRHRAKKALWQFLGVDLENIIQRPMISESSFLVPTLEDPNCTGCHNMMDPIAGSFQNWSDFGNLYLPNELNDGNYTALAWPYLSTNYPKDANGERYYQLGDNWYRDMLAPGFGTESMPGGHQGNEQSLQWLAQQFANDARFADGAVYFWYQGLFGKKPLTVPLDPTTDDYTARMNAFNAQNEIFVEIAATFSQDHGFGRFNVKDLLVELVMSKWFRAKGVDPSVGDRSAELESLGSYHLLTPEQLSRKMEATLGRSWPDMQNITTGYGLIYGGFNASNLTERNTALNTLLTVTIKRMGNELGCNLIAGDFQKPGTDRLLFPNVQLTDTPDSAEMAIRQNIQHLHDHLLNENLAINHTEITRTYNLFQDVWNDRNTPAQKTLACALNNTNDPQYTGRAWASVIQYLISDPMFLYE